MAFCDWLLPLSVLFSGVIYPVVGAALRASPWCRIIPLCAISRWRLCILAISECI